MSPAKLGEWCTRCGAKCSVRIDNGKQIYECPNRHGIQRIEDAPKEELPAETAAPQTFDNRPSGDEIEQGRRQPDLNERADRIDDVAGASQHGTGSHN